MLETIMKSFYALILATMVLMIWVSMSGAKETGRTKSRHPPCYFNPLCRCSPSGPALGMVECRDVPLPKLPQVLNISQVYALHLENNDLRMLEPYFLSSTGLYKLEISNNPIAVVPDEAFLGLERSLWELEIKHGHLAQIPSRAIRYLQKLRVLDLTDNDISHIQPENWRGLESSLEELILADNAITTLPSDAFSGLPMVEVIDLSGNHLRQIDPAVFRDGMGRLSKLILADNQLSSIPYQSLGPLKALRLLDLGYNRITKMQPAMDGSGNTGVSPNFRMDLDVLRLDHNQIFHLEPAAFQYFNTLNVTYLDGNALGIVEDNAFRNAKIRELYLRSCGLTTLSPTALSGLENYLQILDLSGNNISMLPNTLLHRFSMLRNLALKNNRISSLNPAETFNGFQYTLNKLEMSGTGAIPITIQDLRRLRNLRILKLNRMEQNQLSPEDFVEYGIDLEVLYITAGQLKTIKNNAFRHVHGLKKLVLSENMIENVEPEAFQEIGHSLTHLEMAHAFSKGLTKFPSESLQPLVSLKELDLSNNRIQILSDTSFHFLKKLRCIQLQDNVIDQIFKGTFQGDIHSHLEEVWLSFNNIKSLYQHTFVDLASLEQIHLDDNKLESIERRAFMNLKNLKRLNLKGNRIRDIAYEAFQNLPDLEDLDMSYNSLTRFDFSLFDQTGTLSMLKVNVSHNRIGNLHIDMAFNVESDTGIGSYHSNVKVLDMSFNNITFISRQYFRPSELSLTHLYLSHNTLINTTRDVFGNMPFLQWLDLSHNQLFDLDYDSFKNTRRLQVLLVPHNNLDELPNDLLRGLNSLRILDLSYNKLRLIPDNFFRDDGIEKLIASNNVITRIPLPSFSGSAASTLCELDVSWNLITSISQGELLTMFKSLTKLDLSYNRIFQLDVGAFGYLPKLSHLDLSNNNQISLDKHGGSFQGIEDSLLWLQLSNISLTLVPVLPLPNLLTLSLSYNSLPTLPPEMAANLSSLKELDLSHNDLTAIPVVIHSLNKLKSLNLASNPITSLTNTSLLAVADTLEELDMRNFELTTFETGALSKMYALRTLKMSVHDSIRGFNIPRLIESNDALRNLEIEVGKDTIGREMSGVLPHKLWNVTFSGKELRNIDANVLEGMRNPRLNFALKNTSVSSIPYDLFQNVGWVRNVSVDVKDNGHLQRLGNPSTGMKPDLPGKTFLTDIWLSGNRWTCDCDLGWIEVWQRKRRQYLCQSSPSTQTSENEDDYNCMQANDDLRMAICENKNNQTLLEVLKYDIECGWNSGESVKLAHGIVIFIVITLLSL